MKQYQEHVGCFLQASYHANDAGHYSSDAERGSRVLSRRAGNRKKFKNGQVRLVRHQVQLVGEHLRLANERVPLPGEDVRLAW